MSRECIDLFTGLAGFSIAAEVNGVRTVAMCEANEDCQKFLRAAWPGVELHSNVRTFNATRYHGVWAVFGGPPCQPASRAGEQQGAGNNRWLWPEAIRIVKESEPTWFLFENPPGILDVGLDGIISELEGLCYEVQPLAIPACAVDSPQDRDRIWILGHSTKPGRKGCDAKLLQRPAGCASEPITNVVGGSESGWQSMRGSTSGLSGFSVQPVEKSLANSQERGARAGLRQDQQVEQWGGRFSDSAGAWENYVWVECPSQNGTPIIRRCPTGLYEMVDGVSPSLLKALGNSIVWPVAAEIIRAMIQAEEIT